MNGERLTKLEAWLVASVVVIAFAGMVRGFWSISPWVLLTVTIVAAYPLWVYWQKVCGSCVHTNCPLNHNKWKRKKGENFSHKIFTDLKQVEAKVEVENKSLPIPIPSLVYLVCICLWQKSIFVNFFERFRIASVSSQNWDTIFNFHSGRVKLNVVPLPNWLSTQIFPLCPWMICFTIASPSPVPPNSLLLPLSTL